MESAFGKCTDCGRLKRVADVTFKQNVSYFVRRQEREFSGYLCVPCMTSKFLEYEGITLVGTWWGLIGAILGPAFLLINILEYGQGLARILLSKQQSEIPSEVERNSSTIPEHPVAALAERLRKLFERSSAYEVCLIEGPRWLRELFADDLLAEMIDPEGALPAQRHARALRTYLSVRRGEPLTDSRSQKFVERFDRYLLEGTAPSHELGEAFDEFRLWLTKIYEALDRSGAPISADIRDWYLRILLSHKGRPVIAP